MTTEVPVAPSITDALLTAKDSDTTYEYADDTFVPSVVLDTGPDALGPVPATPYDRIEWRPTTGPREVQGDLGKAGYISYISARAARHLMDEWVGAENWAATFREELLAGATVLWCDMSVRLSNGEWLTRSDIGVPGGGNDANMGLKGLVTDATKRAAAAWGVGADAYYYPMVWATVKVVSRQGQKPQVYAHHRAQAEIDRACSDAGWEVGGGSRVEQRDESEDDTPDDVAAEASIDWTMDVKTYCWEHTNRDGEAGLEIFEQVCRRLGLTSFPDEASAFAAKAIADEYLAEWLIGQEAKAEGKVEEPAAEPAEDERPF